MKDPEVTTSQHFARLFDLASELICVVQSDGTLLIRNAAWDHFVGRAPNGSKTPNFFDFVHPDDRRHMTPVVDLTEDSVILDVTGRLRGSDDQWTPVVWTLAGAPEPGAMYALGRPVDGHGLETALTAEIEQLRRDIEDLSELREHLDMCVTSEEATQVIRRFFDEAMDVWAGEIWMMNASRNLLERTALWGGAEHDQTTTMDPMDCWGMRGGRPHSVDPKGAGLPCKHFPVSPRRSMCIPLKGSSEIMGVLTTWKMTENTEASWHAYLLRISAISEVLTMGLSSLLMREVLRSQSIRDPLTSLFNRRYLEESFDREVARAARQESTVGLIVFDIDNFKLFNDRFGHRAGDTALIKISEVLRDIIRTEDVVCRYGGEEFAVIMPGAPLSVTIERAKSIGSGIREAAVQEDSRTLDRLTVSLGVAVYPDHGLNRTDLMEAADQAMFEAKRSGRDCVRVATTVGLSSLETS